MTGLSYSLQLGAAGLLQLRPPPPGPLPLLFASFVPFLLDIPPTSHFSVLGYRMSDKVTRGGSAGRVRALVRGARRTRRTDRQLCDLQPWCCRRSRAAAKRPPPC